MKKVRSFLSLLLVMSVIVSIVPAAFADKVPPDPDELMELFDDAVTAPKAKSILKETEKKVVQSKHGNSIYVLSKPGGGKKLSTVDEGAIVTVYARQSGYSLGIVEGKSLGGWMNSKYLAEAPNGAGDEIDSEADLISHGLAYELGDGEKQDYVKAEDCYKKAIGLGSTGAMARLAMLYYKDDIQFSRKSLYEGSMDSPLGPESHGEQVLELLTNAAKKGDADALYLLAFIFYDDRHSLPSILDIVENDPLDTFVYEELEIDRDAGTALDYYLKAFRKGSADAANKLDEIYYEALMDGDPDGEAEKWMNDRIKEKDPYAMYLYSLHLLEAGKVGDAERYYELAEKTALEQKNAKMMVVFAMLEHDRQEYEGYGDNAKVFELLEKAADAGGTGYVANAVNYAVAIDFGPDYDEDLFEEICSIVKKTGNADELLGMAVSLHGCDSRETHFQAAQFALLSAEKGSLGGLLELACIIQDGGMANPKDWPKGDPQRAFNLVLDAANKNVFPWMCSCEPAIVWMYENGFGCKKDTKKAEKWDEYIIEWEETHPMY